MYCELYSCVVDSALLESTNLVGIILSGGPASVYDAESPHVQPAVWQMIERRSLPVLGICYGMQELTHTLGGTVSPGEKREFGKASLTKVAGAEDGGLLAGLEDVETMWMSHGDKVTALAEGFSSIGCTENSEHAAIANAERNMCVFPLAFLAFATVANLFFLAVPSSNGGMVGWPVAPTLLLICVVASFGLQFHPEVTHSPRGKIVLQNFVVGICKAPTDWSMQNLADSFIVQVSFPCRSSAAPWDIS